MMFVTGANGFIGSNIYNHFKTWNRRAIVRSDNQNKGMGYITCDLTKENEVKNLFDFNHPSVIIHCAANANTKPDSSVFEQNTRMIQNLLKYTHKNCRFVHISSILVYGNSYPFTIPTSDYGASKLACDALVNAATEQDKAIGTNLRICATVGKGMTHGVLKDLIEKAKSDLPYLEVFGECPGSEKPFIHIQNILSTLDDVVSNTYTGNYDICPRDNISVLEIAQLVLETLNISKPIKFNPNKVWLGDNKVLKFDTVNYPSSRYAIIKAIKEHVN